MMMHRRSLIAPALLLCAWACAPAAQGPAAQAPAPQKQAGELAPVYQKEPESGMTLLGTTGQMDEAEIDARFKDALPEMNRCYAEALRQKWFLNGRLSLKLRVGEDGTVRSALIADSTVGCYEVERCVQKVAGQLRFPAPKGGEGELTYPVEFPAKAAVGAWPGDRVAPQMSRHAREVRACPGKAPRPLRLTVYIGPGGKVASAGLSAEGPIEDRTGACLVARAQAWRFEDPLGQLVKASYDFD